MMRLAAEELRHGYTLDDLDRLARVAVQVHWTMASDIQDRYAEAYGAVVEHLYSVPDPPTERDLIAAGQAAIKSWVRGTHRTHGMPLDGGHGGFTVGVMQFWWDQIRPTPSPEGRIIDAETLRTIWPRLDDAGRAALLAIAAHDGNYTKAAQALGVTVKTLTKRADLAVRQYLRWWHEGETPTEVWRRPRFRVDRSVVPCGTPSAYHRHRRRGEPTCLACREALRQADIQRKARRVSGGGTDA